MEEKIKNLTRENVEMVGGPPGPSRNPCLSGIRPPSLGLSVVFSPPGLLPPPPGSPTPIPTAVVVWELGRCGERQAGRQPQPCEPPPCARRLVSFSLRLSVSVRKMGMRASLWDERRAGRWRGGASRSAPPLVRARAGPWLWLLLRAAHRGGLLIPARTAGLCGQGGASGLTVSGPL